MSAEFAGTLNERISIERPSGDLTGTGLPDGRWVAVATCRASIASDGTGPQSEGMVLSAMPRFRVVVRRRSGISVGYRMRWRDRFLTIRRVLDDPGMTDRLTLQCEELRT